MSQLCMQLLTVLQNRRMRPIWIFSFLLLLLIVAVVGSTSPWKSRLKEVCYNSLRNHVQAKKYVQDDDQQLEEKDEREDEERSARSMDSLRQEVSKEVLTRPPLAID